MPTMRQILEKHHDYYEALLGRGDDISIDSATVAAAILALADIMPEVTIKSFKDTSNDKD
jgi:hypothetical protein